MSFIRQLVSFYANTTITNSLHFRRCYKPVASLIRWPLGLLVRQPADEQIPFWMNCGAEFNHPFLLSEGGTRCV